MNTQQKAERLVESLECPPGAGIADIRERVSQVHQKDVVLHPTSDSELRDITGLWVEMEHASHVFYRADDPEIYQAHSIFHEFGHIIADHTTCGVLDFIDSTAIGSASLGGQIQRARARGFRHNDDEDLAEEIAYALSRVVIAGTKSNVRAVFE
ncbi:hypothetical protein [Leucobacter chromiiresistens]|nr:hypothetical protein [Leucobacter chromiiresistens]